MGDCPRRIIALDVGHKRIGVAFSDELMVTAQGSETIIRSTLDKDLEKINELVQTYNAREVVVGLPLNMDGRYSQKTEEVVRFIEALSKNIKLPVKTWDERLTSIQAERVLLEADLTRSKRKRLTDKLAAQLILQSYLNSKTR